MRAATSLIATFSLAAAIHGVTIVSSQAELKRPLGATNQVSGQLKMSPSRITKTDCDNKKGTIKDVIFSLCASGQYCSYTKPDGTAGADCIDKK